MMLEAATGPVIYKTTNKDLIDAGVSVLPIVRFLSIASPVLENDLEWRFAYHNGIVVNSRRNTIAVDLAQYHASKKQKVMLLIIEISHGETLRALFSERGLEVKFVHGGCASDFRHNSIAEFRDEGSDILISSTILDEGIDIPTIDVLVLLSGGKSPIKLLQRIGRGLRWKDSGQLIVYDFLDMMDVDRNPPKKNQKHPKHGFLTKHALERYEYLKEQPGFEVQVGSVQKFMQEESDGLLNIGSSNSQEAQTQ